MRSCDNGRAETPQIDTKTCPGAEAKGELQLEDVQWSADAQLILLDASVSALNQNCLWPKHVELHGFTYNRIAGITTTGRRQKFRDNYITGWLGRVSTYTPQPYEQLARGCAARQASQSWRPMFNMQAASAHEKMQRAAFDT